jgi:hypothetical protein
MQTPDMILLKGKPKTYEIKSIEQDPKGVCWVQFNTGKTFPYSLRDIKKLSLSKEIPYIRLLHLQQGRTKVLSSAHLAIPVF